MLTLEEKKTVEYYDSHADEWSSQRKPSDPSFWDKDIEKFNKLLSKGKIIEIGSGSGREAQRFIKLGYSYIGTDISKELLKIAQQNNPNGKFIESSIYDLSFQKNSFDGFWCCATLLHIPKSKIDEAFKKINEILKKGAIGFISIKESRSRNESKNEKSERFFEYYAKGEFDEILVRSGFDIIETEEKMQKRKNSDIVYWLVFFVKKI